MRGSWVGVLWLGDMCVCLYLCMCVGCRCSRGMEVGVGSGGFLFEGGHDARMGYFRAEDLGVACRQLLSRGYSQSLSLVVLYLSGLFETPLVVVRICRDRHL